MDVRYRGEPAQGSPFTVNVTDQGQGGPVVNFNESDRFFENREADIPIMIPEGSSADYLKCRVTDPEMELLDYELTYDRGSNLYHVRFVPKRPGRHRVDVEYDGVPVDGSPFMMNIEGTEGHKKVFASGDGIKGGVYIQYFFFQLETEKFYRYEYRMVIFCPISFVIQALLKKLLIRKCLTPFVYAQEW